MQTAQIKWVTGSDPETSATKLITFIELYDGTTHVGEGAFYADDEASAPCWHFSNGKEVAPDKAEVIAWADMPNPYTQPILPDGRERRMAIAISDIARELAEVIGRDLENAAPHQLEGINRRINNLLNTLNYILGEKT